MSSNTMHNLTTLQTAIRTLNKEQQEAVEHLGSPLMILAGPGSGKTRVITTKIAWLIQEFQVPPYQILAMTFTNKAAKEMKHRIQVLLQNEQDQDTGLSSYPFVSTFHSFGAYVLRRFHEHARVNRDFQIYDDADQLALVKEANPHINKERYALIRNGIARAKDYGLTASAPRQKLEPFLYENVDCYLRYETLKKHTGNVDFGDLLLKVYDLITDNQSVLEQLLNRWKWFFVDEYQDTNNIQGKLLTTICKNTTNITVVGDDDQSIYKFRGAVIDNILDFEKSFDNTKVIRLNQNYRSTPQIIALANQVINNNSRRYKKGIFSENTGGELPNVCHFQDDNEEQEYIIRLAQKAQYANKKLALFYRANSQSQAYEMALRKAHIPYEVVGALPFFDRAEVKDALALLKVYSNPNDIISLMRIVNKPARGIGITSLNAILAHMKLGNSWQHSWKAVESLLSATAKKGIAFFDNMLSDVSNKKTDNIGVLLRLLLEKSGLRNYYVQKDKENDSDTESNLERFIGYASDFPCDGTGWENFFEQIALNDDKENKHTTDSVVQLMTLHKSKGLEFDQVVICGVENYRIPMLRDTDNGQDELEEERRLFYVGITRAMHSLHLTYCDKRREYGVWRDQDPSYFLDELDNKSIRFIESERYTLYQSSYADVGDSPQSAWRTGDKVAHSTYGTGYIRGTRKNGAHTIVHVDFDNGYEGSFIPKFSADLKKL